MRQLPKFGRDLTDAQHRIARILAREASGRAKAATGARDADGIYAASGNSVPRRSVGDIPAQDKAQDLVPPDTEIAGGDAIPHGARFGYQLPLAMGSYDTTVTVVNVDPITDQPQSSLPLDILVEMRVPGALLARVAFSEPLAFGKESTKSTRLVIPSGSAGGTLVTVGGINRSGYAVRIGFQFERELEL
ncbi:MAG: hypothetical protein ACKVOI_02455 [Dongiaceae bacterium]